MELLYIALVAVAVTYWLRTRVRTRSSGEEGHVALRPRGPVRERADPPAEPPDVNPLVLLGPMDDFFNEAAHPNDIIEHPMFRQATQALAASPKPTEELLKYGAGANWPVAWLALEAIRLRSDDAHLVEPLLRLLNEPSYWSRFFVLRVLEARVPEPILGRVLIDLAPDWSFDPFLVGVLTDFVRARCASETVSTFAGRLDDLDQEQSERVEHVMQILDDAVPAVLAEEFSEWRRTRIDRRFLNAIGKLWEPGGDLPYSPSGTTTAPEDVVDHAALQTVVGQVRSTLTKESPGSVLLVGESGVGKSVAIARVARELLGQGWYVFEASGKELIAGQVLVGQLEERVQRMLEEIRRRPVVWVVPSFLELVWIGRHLSSPIGVLDMVVPDIESGAIRLVGELNPDAFETMVREQPRMRGAVDVVRVMPLADDDALTLARQWAAARGAESVVPEPVMQEAFQLATQYLGESAAPGNLLQFLKRTHDRLSAGDEATSPEVQVDDLLVTLSQLTGLPLSILDQRRGLDLNELRGFFSSRVLGQGEAVECLVERIAMIKAGLADPDRPQGVFLFVGPTGTGKTEIAKALAEYLFGSSERMIRVDMSELQTPDSMGRLLGEPDRHDRSSSVVQEIRKQPFSVILLDEFEKAHPTIWDLFLQLFDDGRLTDRLGNTADFRHAIVIMTSNLGAAMPAGRSLGFVGGNALHSTSDVDRAVNETFRPEFLNRIDRIVIFRPLGRDLMRRLLDKEMRELFTRRGLRHRDWAIEWEEPAIEFLLETGFTPEFGARPLRRAVERYLLTPVAVAIVERSVPEGDSFLFVRRGGEGLEVEWVSPSVFDATPDPATDEESPLRLRAIALDGEGVPVELDLLRAEHAALEAITTGDTWIDRKGDALRAMQGREFWVSPDRFATLGLAEYMDRIEVGFETAGSLLRRIDPGGGRARRGMPAHLMRRLAERLYLIREAIQGLEDGEPTDAFIRVTSKRDPRVESAAGDTFARRVGTMYRDWSARRGMRLTELYQREATGDASYQLVLAVTGFAAFTILRPECGQHVWEIPDSGSKFLRVRTTVDVAPQPDDPPPTGNRALHRQAAASCDVVAPEQKSRIVRRYREQPSPLVRDSVRNWRTGRLDVVMRGDFDLMT